MLADLIEVPYVDPPLLQKSKVSREKLATDHRGSYKPYVKEAIIKNVLLNTNSAPLVGLVFDMFCSSIVDVGNELGVPSYLFFTCNADFLGLMLYLPGRDDEVGREFEEFDSDYIIPGYVNPIPSRNFPLFLFNKYGGYDTFVKHGRRFKETKGIFVNTFEELEAHVVKCLLNDFDHMPPIYTVGPMIDLKSESDKGALEKSKRNNCSRIGAKWGEVLVVNTGTSLGKISTWGTYTWGRDEEMEDWALVLVQANEGGGLSIPSKVKHYLYLWLGFLWCFYNSADRGRATLDGELHNLESLS
ncbi:UDP-glycosyltransferase 71K1-like [Pistacia vera]|uniref:UDP-glycosyltransferase 71K1-like n=1 Tax=Pistacia vera TaxID=55513 RepID=UPI0012633063|nr:UDP-glycosyltransferase 71K1-like [Pistacia vera]